MTQQEARAKKSSHSGWLVLILLLLVTVAGISVPVYRQQQVKAPQKLFSRAIEQEGRRDIAAAEISYREVYQRYPGSKEAAEALLKIGKIWQYDYGDEQKALLSYLQLEHDYPNSPLILTAREEAARIVKYTLHDYSRAVEFYSRLLELNAGSADQYYYEIADCYFRLENYPQARIELEILLASYPNSSLTASALHRKGGILLLEGEAELAQQNWRSLIEQYPDSQYRVQAEFDLAKLLEEEAHLQEALQRYQQLEGKIESPLLREKIKHLQQRIAAKKEAI